MKETDQKKATTMSEILIAPCGMNCRLCWGYIRDKNACPGCLIIDSQESRKSKCRSTCRIKNCERLLNGQTKHCSKNCQSFPCYRLRQLDKRYTTKYAMSMLDNLRMINEMGIRAFIQTEAEKWVCPECGEIICVHKPVCLACGCEWHQNNSSMDIGDIGGRR